MAYRHIYVIIINMGMLLLTWVLAWVKEIYLLLTMQDWSKYVIQLGALLVTLWMTPALLDPKWRELYFKSKAWQYKSLAIAFNSICIY